MDGWMGELVVWIGETAVPSPSTLLVLRPNQSHFLSGRAKNSPTLCTYNQNDLPKKDTKSRNSGSDQFY